MPTESKALKALPLQSSEKEKRKKRNYHKKRISVHILHGIDLQVFRLNSAW